MCAVGSVSGENIVKAVIRIVATLLAVLSQYVVHAAEAEPIRFDDLVEVRYKSELPKFIRSQLQMDGSGSAGVAEIGERFSPGESSSEGFPSRRLLGAGARGDTWLVAIEQGGKKGPELRVFRFEGEKQVSETSAGNYGGVLPPTFRSVVEGYVESPRVRTAGPSSRISGVAIGMSRDEVLKLLGAPREPLGSTYPILRYKGLDIWINQDSLVVRMRSNSPANCLGADLCPGKPAAAAQAVLGAPWWTHYGTSRYSFDADSCWVDVAATGEGSLTGPAIASLDVVCEAQR